MIKGWRLIFYAVIAAAVLSIAYITVKFIVVEKRVKDTGDPKLELRQRTAQTILRGAERSESRRKAVITFLQGQPSTVRDNVVWSVEQMVSDGKPGHSPQQAINWLVDIACDLSGDLPTGDADWDSARLAVQRVGKQAVQPLIGRLGELTKRTLERDTYAHRRAVAARLLGVIGDQQAVKPLVAALRDDYDSVRQQAAAALARIGGAEAETELRAYLAPLVGVLRGEYLCYVRVDSEGRIRNVPDRSKLVYGPFVVKVKPHDEANAADLARQRDSAADITKHEEERAAETRRRLEEGRKGQVIKTVRGPVQLEIEQVTVSRQGEQVVDPMGKAFDVVEGEPMEVAVNVVNRGPGDLVNDFFTAVYGASPMPKNHADLPDPGQPFAGERARDNRALAGQAESRHVRTLYGHDRPETRDRDDTRDRIFVSIRFNNTEADRIEALRQLMDVADESTIPVLGESLRDRSYTVRRLATQAIERIMEAQRTTPAGRAAATAILRTQGLTSPDAVVRCLAAEGLRIAADPQTAAALQRLLLTDSDATVRLVATRALAGLPAADRDRMVQGLVGENSPVRLVAPRLLTKETSGVAARLLMGGDAELSLEVLRSASRLLTTDQLVGALQLKDPRARAMAARLLDERSDPRSRDALLRALQDPDGDVRASAAQGLGELMKKNGKDPQVIAALAQVIKNEAGDYVGVPAKQEPADPTTAVITNKKSRAAAAEALADLHDPAAIPALKDALADDTPEVLAAVLPAVASGDLGDQSERLIKIEEDAKKQPPRIRQQAALAMWHSNAKGMQGLDKKKAEKALDSLVGLLNDPNDTVKTSAAVALIGLGDSRGDKVLRDQLTSKNKDVRREAATLMATLPDDKVKKIAGLKDEDRDGLNILIEELYQSGSLPVSFRFLCRSLVFLGEQAASGKAANGAGARVVERMKQALSDPHPVLRAAGLAVLSQLKDDTARIEAPKYLGDANEVTREAAVEAVAELHLVDQVPTLEAMTTKQPDPSQDVQLALGEALARLGAVE